MRKSPHNWHEMEFPFGDTPTQIFVGDKDLQVPQGVRDWLEKIRNNYIRKAKEEGKERTVYYRLLKEVGHDVIATEPLDQAFSVYENIYYFLGNFVKVRQPDKSPS